MNHKIIISIVGAVLIAGVSTLWLIQPSDSNEAVNNEVANWKTYTNSSYGFELKYPQFWKVGVLSDSSVSFRPEDSQDVSMSVYVFDKTVSESERLMPVFSVPGRKINSRTNILISGISWEKLVVEENQIVQLTYHDRRTFGAQYSTFEDTSPKILSTFKFTK